MTSGARPDRAGELPQSPAERGPTSALAARAASGPAGATAPRRPLPTSVRSVIRLLLRAVRARHLLAATTVAAALVALAAAPTQTRGTGPAASARPAALPGRDRLPAPAAARAAAPLHLRDLRYGAAPAQTLDVVLPPAVRPRRAPAVLLVHGGGWFAGDKQRLTGIATRFAEAGFVVFNANYTLATRLRPGYPRQPRELRQALRWIAAHGPAFGADPERLGALGTSAGGNLVALLATSRPPTPGRPAVRAVVTWSAPLDLTALADRHLRGLAATFTGCRGGAWCAPRLATASPLHRVRPGTAPMLLVNSRAELVPAAQARRMAAALARAGVDHELRLVPGDRHGRELAGAALAASIAFLRARL